MISPVVNVVVFAFVH